MAALGQRPVSSVNGDVDVSLDVPGDMTEDDVVHEEDIQKEVRTIVGHCFEDRSPLIRHRRCPLREQGVPSDRWPAVWEVGCDPVG